MRHLRQAFCAALQALSLILALSTAHPVFAQSTYGLAARATIPVVISVTPKRIFDYSWTTQVEVHNPGPIPIEVAATFFGMTGSVVPGRHPCHSIGVGPGQTRTTALAALCTFPPGPNIGRLELDALQGIDPTTGEPSKDPSQHIFLSKALMVNDLYAPFVTNPFPGPRDSDLITIEGIPQGLLSGNKGYAVVTGLKQGLVNGSNWQSSCVAASHNENSQANVLLREGNSGQQIGGMASINLNAFLPPVMERFGFPGIDIFSAVGAPAGPYDNVTAYFSAGPQGGESSGLGIIGYCWIRNVTTSESTFAIAKYLDNNDEGREFQTAVSKSAFGRDFLVLAEIPNGDQSETNLHVAYFQHPDRVSCRIETGAAAHLSTFSQSQIRLIDPSGNVVAGGAHATEFTFDLGEKSTRNHGRNGRWLIEVAPDDAYFGGGGLYAGGLDAAPYRLTCASGNGHNQLDITGHCPIDCASNSTQSRSAVCSFPPTFDRRYCWN